jgi:hypothetical protein
MGFWDLLGKGQAGFPVRPFGKLCPECKPLLARREGLRPGHHKSYDDLKICAQQACDLCALFLTCGNSEISVPYEVLTEESSSVLVGIFIYGFSEFWCLRLHIWTSSDDSLVPQELFSSRVFLTPVRQQGMW